MKDPHEVVKAGDIVKVRVVEVDVQRKRIALSMRKDGGAPRRLGARPQGAPPQGRPLPGGKFSSPPSPPAARQPPRPAPPADGPLAAALAEAMRRKGG